VSGRSEGHSTPGLSTLANHWYFAEGDAAYFATYYALLNPGTTAATVRLTYLHANGQTYTQDVTVPAQRRATVVPSSVVPAGSFGCHVAVLSGAPIAAERMLYGGPSWTISHAGVGADQLATTWRFTEGTNGNGGFFETYLLLANPGTAAAAVTMTFFKTNGTVATSTTTVPAGSRVNVWVKGVPGMDGVDEFRTVVSVTNGVPIVAERATYWPINTGGSVYGAAAMVATDAATGTTIAMAGATVARPPAVQTFDPYSPATAHGPEPRLYERLIGYSATGRKTRASEPSPDTGPPVNGVGTTSSTPTALSVAPQATTLSITTTWYGAHLTGGRRQ
jgi:hypothetical protein